MSNVAEYPSLQLEKLRSGEAYQPMKLEEFNRLLQQFKSFSAATSQGFESKFYQPQFIAADKAVQIYLSEQALGWGQIAFNQKGQQNLFIQAPHRFFDQYTGHIVDSWWQSGKLGWVFMNSVNRYLGKNLADTLDSDFSSAEPNPLVAVSTGYLASHNNGLIIQVHGFNSEKRSSVFGKKADFIISHGQKGLIKPTTISNNLKQCLNNKLNALSYIFPNEVNELGATKSQTSRALAQRYQHYIHIEISDSMRYRLMNNPEDNQLVLDCILQLTSQE